MYLTLLAMAFQAPPIFHIYFNRITELATSTTTGQYEVRLARNFIPVDTVNNKLMQVS